MEEIRASAGDDDDEGAEILTIVDAVVPQDMAVATQGS